MAKGSFLYLGSLPNLYLPIDKLDLDDFVIEKITRVEIKSYFPGIDFDHFLEWDYSESPFFIRVGQLTESPTEKISPSEMAESNGKKIIFTPPLGFYDFDKTFFNKELLLLNLFQKTNLPVFTSLGLIRYISDKGKYLTRGVSSRVNLERLRFVDQEGNERILADISLREEDISSLKAFKKQIFNYLLKENSNRKERFIQISLQFFMEGCTKETEDNEEMAVLDYVIGLESLLLHPGEKSELKYRFANRLAVLLGNSDDERYLFQEYGKKLYDLRSEIAHGTLLKSEIQKELRVLSYSRRNKYFSIRDLLRMSIIFILSIYYHPENQFNDHTKVTTLLDSALFKMSDVDKIRIMRTRLRAIME